MNDYFELDEVYWFLDESSCSFIWEDVSFDAAGNWVIITGVS